MNSAVLRSRNLCIILADTGRGYQAVPLGEFQKIEFSRLYNSEAILRSDT